MPEIRPTNEVRLYKSVPFSIDYSNIVRFDNLQAQQNYFNSLPKKELNNLTYTRNNGIFKCGINREQLLDYNYMSFKNSNYGDKTFYAFIVNVEYDNPNMSYVSFVIDEWQSHQFEITFRNSFIERKHCRRWNADGTPVINTVPEGLEMGSEIIVKGHEQYNNDLYWACVVTTYQASENNNNLQYNYGVPCPLQFYYLPIYRGANNNNAFRWTLDGRTMSDLPTVMSAFTRATNLVGTLVKVFYVEDPPFNFNYTYSNNIINITNAESDYFLVDLDVSYTIPDSVPLFLKLMVDLASAPNPYRRKRTYPKYTPLMKGITESKLLMYPYSYIDLIDGSGNQFIIKNEFVQGNEIVIESITSKSVENKVAYLVNNYIYEGVSLRHCRWELGQGIISNNPNQLTTLDEYTAAYLQGNANTLNANITNQQLQAEANSLIGQSTTSVNMRSAIANQNTVYGSGIANMFGQGLSGNIIGAIGQGIATGIQANNYTTQAMLQNELTAVRTNTQNQLNKETLINSQLAKLEDIKNMPDNVALQGGDVFFTFQNRYNGYCLVYKQISQEYINILTKYFEHYGYRVNTFEVPNIHTRQSWDYIKCVDVNIIGSFNHNSLDTIKKIFNNGVTIWHTTDVGNYSLPNNEI